MTASLRRPFRSAPAPTWEASEGPQRPVGCNRERGSRFGVVMYLLALFLPPLAILFCGRPVQAVLNALLWLLGLVLLVLPFVPGVFTWGLAVVWALAVVHARKQAARDRRLVADALARVRPPE